MNGLGTGVCYFVPLVCGWEYFPQKKGIVTGMILAGYGFSSFIFSQVSTALANPNHENPDVEAEGTDITFYGSSVTDRVPYMLQTLATIWVFFLLTAIVLITRPAKDEVFTESQNDSRGEEEASSPNLRGGNSTDIQTGHEYRSTEPVSSQ